MGPLGPRAVIRLFIWYKTFVLSYNFLIRFRTIFCNLLGPFEAIGPLGLFWVFIQFRASNSLFNVLLSLFRPKIRPQVSFIHPYYQVHFWVWVQMFRVWAFPDSAIYSPIPYISYLSGSMTLKNFSKKFKLNAWI